MNQTCIRRCTSVLSDDSELSTLCDEELLRKEEEGFGANEEEIRPELLSSSEDSSPESDLPFSKKFLNVFVNSTTRSSSKSDSKQDYSDAVACKLLLRNMFAWSS